MSQKHWLKSAGHARKACGFPRFAAVAACVRCQKKLSVSKLPTAFSATEPARLVAIKNRGDRIRTCDLLVPNQAL